MTNQSSFSTISRAASSLFVMEILVPLGTVAAKEWGSCREGVQLVGHRGLGHFWVCHPLLRVWGPSGGANPKPGLGRVRVDPSVDSAAL